MSEKLNKALEELMAYREEAKAMARMEDSEYNRLVNTPRFKKLHRDTELHKRKEECRDIFDK